MKKKARIENKNLIIIGLIGLVILLVFTLFVRPIKVEIVGLSTEGSAVLSIANPPREALPQQIESSDGEVEETGGTG